MITTPVIFKNLPTAFSSYSFGGQGNIYACCFPCVCVQLFILVPDPLLIYTKSCFSIMSSMILPL